MDDSCVVCAETLQWVAYGPCGHHEVCSTCVVRLRFICEDRRCCLCKSESGIIFITKALGDFTRMINDFTILPADPREGKVGVYWYHEGTQAYFDDVDHYKMIKAMCRLSCSVCDKENERNEGSKRRGDFKNVELLKSHLAQRHRLSMCSLCLEGRKVFICEQKLYTQAQLEQHVRTGDSVVDGSETERGGFTGHPLCQFCKMPFYGESELYSHMSTEHYTCHICQRQHPGQYEYFKNYDDLEIHFRQAHFLCENEGCLEKKFVVFPSESEMKRHNVMEHGGRMSQCKRSAALQIPVSFQYRESNHHDRHGRGRGRRVQPDLAESQPALSLQAAPDTASAVNARDTSTNARMVSNHRETSVFESASAFELLNTLESESSSVHSNGFRQNSRAVVLDQSSFPPLPAAPSRSKKKTKNGIERLGSNSNASRAWSGNGPAKSLVHNFPQLLRPPKNSGLTSSTSSPSFKSSTRNTRSSSTNKSDNSDRLVQAQEPSSSTSSSTAGSSRKLVSNGVVNLSSSTPNLVGRESFDDPTPQILPISAAQKGKAATSNQTLLKDKEVNAANKSLVERIRLAIEYDENKFAAFKEISSQFRHGIINTEEYLASVCQFGLSHLVLELARLCPDQEKQRELVETYNFNTRNTGVHINSSNNDSVPSNDKGSSKKGKEKCEDNRLSGKEKFEDSQCHDPKEVTVFFERMMKIWNDNMLDGAGVASNPNQHSLKGKGKVLMDVNQSNFDPICELRMGRPGQNGRSACGDGTIKIVETAGGENKQRKKTPKFLRTRLGDDAAALTELGCSNTGSDRIEGKIEEDKGLPKALPVSGVWQNGGGRKLVAMTQRDRRRR